MSKHLINRSVFREYYIALLVVVFFIFLYYFFFEYADQFFSQDILTWLYEKFIIITFVITGTFLTLFFYLIYRSRQFMAYLEITPERLKIIEQYKEKTISQKEIFRSSIKKIYLVIREILNRNTGKTSYFIYLGLSFSEGQEKLSLSVENAMEIINELFKMKYPIQGDLHDYQSQIMAVYQKEKSDVVIDKWILLWGIIGFVFILCLVGFLLYFLRDFWI